MHLSSMLFGSLLLLLSFCDALATCESTLFQKIKNDVLYQSYETLSTAELTFGNRFGSKVYLGSQEIFQKKRELISHAKKQILIQTWNFEAKSEPAQLLAKALQELKIRREMQQEKDPVNVWFIINVTALQNYESKKREFLNFVREHQLHNQYVQIKIGIFRAKLLGANHVKNIIIDNKIGLVTGANASHYFDQGGLFDAGFALEGEAVHSMSKDFLTVWKERFKDQETPRLIPRFDSETCTPILFTRNDSVSSPIESIQKSSINTAFISSIRRATKRVDIFTPSLNVNEFINEISRAIRHGIEVRVILSKKYEAFKQDLPTRGGSNEIKITQLMTKLFRHLGKRETCKLLKIKWYSPDGKRPALKAKGPNSHVKYMQVDDQLAYVGSSNMDRQSWVNSREIGLFIDSQYLSKQWNKQLFDPAFKRGIKIDECRKSL